MSEPNDRPRVPSSQASSEGTGKQESFGAVVGASEIAAVKVKVLEMLTSSNADFESFVSTLGTLLSDASEQELGAVLDELKKIHKKIGGGGLLGRDIIDRMLNLPTLSTMLLFGSFLYLIHASVNKDQEGVRLAGYGMAVGVWGAVISIIRAFAYRDAASKEDVKKRRAVIQELIALFEAEKLKRQNASSARGRSVQDLKAIEPPKDKPFSM
jgi:hypothetical protein